MSNSRYVEITCDIIRTTDGAVLIDIDGEEIWIPRSQIEDGEDIAGQNIEDYALNITRWIADQKGIEVD